jgi:hypothetical protein
MKPALEETVVLRVVLAGGFCGFEASILYPVEVVLKTANSVVEGINLVLEVSHVILQTVTFFA